jgi:hypothetical protein
VTAAAIRGVEFTYLGGHFDEKSVSCRRRREEAFGMCGVVGGRAEKRMMRVSEVGCG